MTIRTAPQLKAFFETGDKPTETQFGDLIDTLIDQRIVLSVKDPLYGAVGDGTTDDTGAIDATITAARSGGYKGVYFPPGAYKTTGNSITGSTWAAGGLHIFGAANEGSIISVFGTNPAFDDATGNVHYHDLTFVNNADATSTRAGFGIRGALSRGSVQRCRFIGFSRGIDNTGGIISTIQENYFTRCDTGIYNRQSGSMSSAFSNLVLYMLNFMEYCDIGFDLSNHFHNTLILNNVQNGTGVAIAYRLNQCWINMIANWNEACTKGIEASNNSSLNLTHNYTAPPGIDTFTAETLITGMNFGIVSGNSCAVFTGIGGYATASNNVVAEFGCAGDTSDVGFVKRLFIETSKSASAVVDAEFLIGCLSGFTGTGVAASGPLNATGTKTNNLKISKNAIRFYQPKYFGSSGNVLETWGTGSPEGVITAGVASTYRRIDGGAGTSFYVKESGTGNTGWVGK